MDILEFEKKIDYKFKNEALLKNAFCHSSYANEHKKLKLKSNERLEFLGDAVLELVISEYIYENYKDMPEGELTKFRAAIVCEPTLAKEARKLDLGTFLMLGKGEEHTNGRNRDSILADAFEAVIGAVFLDGGIDKAREYILKIMIPVTKELQSNFKITDYKTFLQEIMQRESKETVIYEIIAETGPDHDKSFIAAAFHKGIKISEGSGKTKKDAQQKAAFNFLKERNEI